MSEDTKATIEILEHYHHNGGFYEIPVEIINTVEQELEEQEEEIERLKNDIKRITNICNEKIKIINDVREYIGSKEHYEDDFDTEIEKLYKILDKEK